MATFADIMNPGASRIKKAVSITDVTKFPALQLQYIGPYQYAKCTVAAGGDMTIKADDTDGATTTYASIDLSTPGTNADTFGELKDLINSYDYLRCYLIGVKPDQSTDNKLDTLTATSITGDNGLTVYCDEATSSNTDQGFAITNQKFLYRPVMTGEFDPKKKYAGWVTDKGCINTLDYLGITLTNTSSGVTEIYTCDDSPGVNGVTELWEDAYVTATAEAHGGTSPDTPVSPFIASVEGQRLLVWFDAAAAITGVALTASGSTIHQGGGLVAKANYTGCV